MSLAMPRRTATSRLLAGLAVAAMALVPTAAFADSSSPSPSATSTASATSSASASTFTVGFLQDVDSLNPFVGILSSTYEAWGVTYDYLIGYSQKDFTPVPELAESWTESSDHLTWTYKIRKGLKWSDGVPLTAQDAAYTFNRIINGSFEQTNYGNYVANITKAEAPDDTTLILTVSKPTPIMVRLAVPILPEHIWKPIDEKAVQTYKNEPIVGSGPFIFEQHQTGQFLRFKANPNYFLGAPKIKELVFRIFQSEDTMVAALKKGEIDFADSLGSTSFASLKGAAGITTVPAEYSGFDELAMNTGAATDKGVAIGDGNPALKDKRLRQAIDTAIDRKTLVDKVLGGYGQEGSTIIPPIYALTHLEPANHRDFDIAKANQMLDDAGYTKGSDGIRTDPNNGGKKLSFRLFGRDDSPTSKDSVQYIEGWLKQIGIDTQVQIVSENKLTDIIGNGEYDLFEWGWVVEPDPNYQLSTFLCSSRSTKDGGTITAGLSDSFYCNPAYDTLFAQQAATTDATARTAIVKQMQQMLYDDAPYSITYYYANLEAYRSDRFTNLQPQPVPNGVLLFQYGTYTYRAVEPVSDAAVADSSSSTSTGLWIGIGIVVILLIAGGGLLVARSSRGSDDRE